MIDTIDMVKYAMEVKLEIATFGMRGKLAKQYSDEPLKLFEWLPNLYLR